MNNCQIISVADYYDSNNHKIIKVGKNNKGYFRNCSMKGSLGNSCVCARGVCVCVLALHCCENSFFFKFTEGYAGILNILSIF